MSERKLLFLMNQEQAREFARLLGAAERGVGAAACRLGDMYRVGEGGLRYSPAETFRWYAKSALTGDADGQCNLGACYEHGLGCVQSYTKAVKWYRRSESQGVGTAAINLGYCYLRGHGVPADKVEALRLFRLAVERGEDKAVQEVERLEAGRGPRVLQLAPADTAQVRPCSLAVGVLPPDGPREQLQPSQTAPTTSRVPALRLGQGTRVTSLRGPRCGQSVASGSWMRRNLGSTLGWSESVAKRRGVEGVAERYAEYLRSRQAE